MYYTDRREWKQPEHSLPDYSILVDAAYVLAPAVDADLAVVAHAEELAFRHRQLQHFVVAPVFKPGVAVLGVALIVKLAIHIDFAVRYLYPVARKPDHTLDEELVPSLHVQQMVRVGAEYDHVASLGLMAELVRGPA